MIQSLFGSPKTEPNLLDRLKAGIQKTRAGLMEKIEDAVSGRKEIDAGVLEELEYALITADIGTTTTNEILERTRQRVERHLAGDIGEEKFDPRTSARNPASQRAGAPASFRAA